jgi:hypothetical protein
VAHAIQRQALKGRNKMLCATSISPVLHKSQFGTLFSWMPLMLHFLDYLFLITHSLLILLNLFGWAWKPTRKANLIALSLTAFSWVVLGIFYGFGYCPLTDWHWKILHKLDENDLPNSYITYLVHRLFGWDIDPLIIDWVTGVSFTLVLLIAFGIQLHSSRISRQQRKLESQR